LSEHSNWVPPFAFEEDDRQEARPAWAKRLWLHVLLLLLTFASTTVFGFAVADSFYGNRPFNFELTWDYYPRLLHGDPALLSGLAFSVPLLLILLAHEFGHYFACRYWRVDASLPYFMPSPTLLGTLGAFIKIRSPIYNRCSLFDIGFSGPICGFLVLLPFLIIGVGISHVSPGMAERGNFVFGTPLILQFVEWLWFPSATTADILLHPVARAAWAGLLATAINLLPIGQLDGGHILFSFFADIHKPLSRLFSVLLLPLGIFYWPWVLWAVVLFFLGSKHPLIYDRTPLNSGRVKLGFAALLIFLVSFSVVPVRF
jgi:membrane-associated protease RseP (regulator of RpoE activity)